MHDWEKCLVILHEMRKRGFLMKISNQLKTAMACIKGDGEFDTKKQM